VLKISFPKPCNRIRRAPMWDALRDRKTGMGY
jgi:hypothetical protein